MRTVWLSLLTWLCLCCLATDPARAESPPPEEATTEEVAPPSEDSARDQMLAAFAMSDEDKAQYAALLRDVVGKVRGKVRDKLAAKIAAKQAEKLDSFAMALGGFALCGVFLLALPLVLRRKYPGQGRTLFKYSALAALLFFLAVNLFAVVLLAMRGAQGAVGEYTNPQVQIVESTFDLFAKKAEDLSVIGPTLVEPTLASLTGDSDQPVVSQMLANVQKLKSDFTVFTSIASVFQKVDWLFGILPLILIGIAVLLFAKVARPTLVQIVRLPERAASGDRGAARETVRLTLRNVWAEAKAAFATMGVLVGLTLVGGVLLGFVLQPALEVFISYLTMSLLYVQLSPSASSFWVMFSLVGSILFLVLNLAVVIVASAMFLGKAQQIFQRKFREGVPLSAHAAFWKRGSLGAVWAQVLPVLYILVAVEGIGWVAEKSMEKFFDAENPANSSWALILASGPALFLLTFAVVFWAARGLASIKYLARYKPALAVIDATAPAGFARVDLPVETIAAPTTRPSPWDLPRAPTVKPIEPATVWESFAPPRLPRTPSSSSPPPVPSRGPAHEPIEEAATVPFLRDDEHHPR